MTLMGAEVYEEVRIEKIGVIGWVNKFWEWPLHDDDGDD